MSATLRVKPGRVLLMSAALTAVIASLLLVVVSLGPTPAATMLAVAIGIVLMPLMASPVEWVVHRYVYHRPLVRALYEVHHRVHHFVYFPTWRYVTGGPPRRIPVFGDDHHQVHDGRLANALTRVAHFTFYMLLAGVTIWIPVWLLTSSAPLLSGVVLASVVVSDLMVTVHDTIHRPGAHPLIERRFWFRFLDRHHYIHHVDTEANVNFLLPLADWLFGTMRRELTPAEREWHGSWEDAKATPVGSGEPARDAVRAAGISGGRARAPAEDRAVALTEC